jgi:hypothetical protein
MGSIRRRDASDQDRKVMNKSTDFAALGKPAKLPEGNSRFPDAQQADEAGCP